MHRIHSRFRALFNKERIKVIGNDWHQKDMKKIEKDSWKSQIWKALKHGFLGFVCDLIHWHTYTQCNPNARHKKAAPKNTKQLCIIFIKNSKLFSQFQRNSKQKNHPTSLPRLPGIYSNQNHTSILKELVDRSLTFF